MERCGARLPSVAALTARYRLTAREAQVGLLITQGKTNSEIASILGVTAHTARRHTEKVLVKVGVHSRAAASASMREC
jgi:DNA-binding CsgD family transcriptional regulator